MHHHVRLHVQRRRHDNGTAEARAIGVKRRLQGPVSESLGELRLERFHGFGLVVDRNLHLKGQILLVRSREAPPRGPRGEGDAAHRRRGRDNVDDFGEDVLRGYFEAALIHRSVGENRNLRSQPKQRRRPRGVRRLRRRHASRAERRRECGFRRRLERGLRRRFQSRLKSRFGCGFRRRLKSGLKSRFEGGLRRRLESGLRRRRCGGERGRRRGHRRRS
mmetsp:Transcript_27897/g.93883  ORF Transcript_27897/g.93883 Transcript_27897/m.93883 type:complete len:219 (+) Transcript_27897:1514-2170(+)